MPSSLPGQSPAFKPLPDEVDMSVRAVEARFLAAVDAADFMYLYNSEGYIGPMVGLELGYAIASGKPVFAKEGSDYATAKSTWAVLPSYRRLSLWRSQWKRRRSPAREHLNYILKNLRITQMGWSGWLKYNLVAPPRLELGTQGSSGLCSTN